MDPMRFDNIKALKSHIRRTSFGYLVNFEEHRGGTLTVMDAVGLYALGAKSKFTITTDVDSLPVIQSESGVLLEVVTERVRHKSKSWSETRELCCFQVHVPTESLLPYARQYGDRHRSMSIVLVDGEAQVRTGFRRIPFGNLRVLADGMPIATLRDMEMDVGEAATRFRSPEGKLLSLVTMWGGWLEVQ